MKQLHIFTIFLTPKSFFDGQFRYLTDCGYEVVLVCSYEKGVEEFAERNGIRYLPVEIPRSISPMGIVRAIWQIRAVIKRERPLLSVAELCDSQQAGARQAQDDDGFAVFGHTPVGALCAMVAARWCGVRNRVYYRHGLIYTTMHGVKRFVFKMEERFVSALATDIVNVSGSLSELAVADHLNGFDWLTTDPDSKQHVIGHGTCGGIDAHGLFNPEVVDKEEVDHLAKVLGMRD